MQKQQGAALIIVLVLLSVSLVIGMSGMNAAMVDERLAGNYRAAALAQMYAESAAAKGVKAHSADSWQEAEEVTKESLKAMEYATFVERFAEEVCDVDNETGHRCAYGYVVIDDQDHIVALGSVYDAAGVVVAKSMPIFVELTAGGGESGTDTELEGLFGYAGMLARRDVEIENDRRFDLYGNVLYGRDFESEGSFYDQDGGVSKLDDDFPAFDVSAKREQLGQQGRDAAEGGACRLDNAGGSRGLCTYSGGHDFKETTFSNVMIDAKGDVEFERAAHFSDVTIISGGQVEFAEGSTFSNVTILAEGQVEIDEARLFSDVYIVAKDKIEINNALDFSNVTLISEDDVEVKLEKGNVDGGWFYADGEIELKMENGAAFEGSLVAGKDIELETESAFTFRHRNWGGGLFGNDANSGESGASGKRTVRTWTT